MTRVLVRLPWGRRRALTAAELTTYALIAVWVVFVLWAAWQTQREASDNALYVGIRIVGGTASTFVAVAAAWILFFYQRRMVTRRRILSKVAARNHAALPPSVSADVIHQLVDLLAADDAASHLVVEADDTALRTGVVRALSEQLARREVLPVWVTSAETTAGFEEAAKRAFLAVAEHAGERGEDLSRLWTHLWDQRAVTVIATGLDAGEAPGEPGSVARVAERLDDLSRLDVPTIALVATGLTDPEQISTVFDPAPVAAATRATPVQLDPLARDALVHIGRLLHLRNETSWTWADVPASESDGALTMGMAWLIANGRVIADARGVLRFCDRHWLACARGLGAGADAASHWATLLELPVTAVTLESLEVAARDNAIDVACTDSPLGALSDRMQISQYVAHDLSVFTAVYAGAAARLGVPRVAEAVTGGSFTAWRPAAPGVSPDPEQPDVPEQPLPTDHARLLAVGRLRIATSPVLLAWAWPELRDAAQTDRALTYPIRRALITELATNSNLAVDALVDAWHETACTVTGDAGGLGALLNRNGHAGPACHLAWLLPLVYAHADDQRRSRLAPSMALLQNLSCATARLARTDPDASTDYLQAWAEGLYHGAVAIGPAGQGTLLDEYVASCLAEPSSWPGDLALVMSAVALGRPCPPASDRRHPIVLAMLGELRKIDALTGAKREEALERVMWREEFAELRSAAPGLSQQVRWILAAKAILFSGAEIRRGEKGSHRPSGIEERRQLMLGAEPLPRWLSVSWEGGSLPGDSGIEVTVDGIRERPDRRVTRTFARLVLAGPKPESASADRAQRVFWASIERALRQLATHEPMDEADPGHASRR